MERESLDTIIERKFKHLSDAALVARINRAADFKWDDEGYEVNRRGLNVEMRHNTLVLVKDYQVTKNHEPLGVMRAKNTDELLLQLQGQYGHQCYGFKAV